MFPNLLTFARIFAIPFIVACFYVEGFFSHLIATLLFVVACLTDFFDGYLARQWKQVSALGRFLDPVADKLLVATTLLMLSGVGMISGTHLIASVIILAREIMVSGLRQFMAEMKVRVPVTKFAKWKTAMQMVSISCLLCSAMFPEIPVIKQIGLFLLWVAVIMTVATCIRYLHFGAVKIATEMDQQD